MHVYVKELKGLDPKQKAAVRNYKRTLDKAMEFENALNGVKSAFYMQAVAKGIVPPPGKQGGPVPGGGGGD